MIAESLVIVFLCGTAFGAALALLGRTAAFGTVQRIYAQHADRAVRNERRGTVGNRVFRGEYMPPPAPAARPKAEWREAGSNA